MPAVWGPGQGHPRRLARRPAQHRAPRVSAGAGGGGAGWFQSPLPTAGHCGFSRGGTPGSVRREVPAPGRRAASEAPAPAGRAREAGPRSRRRAESSRLCAGAARARLRSVPVPRTSRNVGQRATEPCWEFLLRHAAGSSTPAQGRARRWPPGPGGGLASLQTAGPQAPGRPPRGTRRRSDPGQASRVPRTRDPAGGEAGFVHAHRCRTRKHSAQHSRGATRTRSHFD